MMAAKNIKKFGRIGVLMGGYSSEREISLKSGKAVFEALQGEGVDVAAIDIREQNEDSIASQILESMLDAAFITLHGQLGEDGVIQSILEKLGILYTGSGVEASRLAFNKVLSRRVFQDHHVAITPGLVLEKSIPVDIDQISAQLKQFPVIVKPSCEGSSIGISFVEHKNDLAKAIGVAAQFGHEILIERFIKGKELTVGILDEKALPVVEIHTGVNFFDYAAKYKSAKTQYIVPAEIPVQARDLLQAQALRAHQALGCRGFSRVDFILDTHHQPYVLEINTIPGFTSTSLLPKAAQAAGLNFSQLCIKILELAHGQKKKNFNTAAIH